MISEWKAPLRQLYSFLVTSEEQLNLLRNIDLESMDDDVSLEQLIFTTIDQLVRLSKADSGFFYVSAGERFLLCHSTDGRTAPETLDASSFPATACPGTPTADSQQVFLLSRHAQDPLLDKFPGAGALVHTAVGGKNGSSLGNIVLASAADIEGTSLDDPGVKRFLQSVGLQLSNAVRFRANQTLRAVESSIFRDFYAKGMDPKGCLQAIVKHVLALLPSFGPLRISPTPQIQILLYDEGKQHMRVIATTGNEPDNTLVSVRDSFCGALIRDPSMPYYLEDPRRDPRYKAYLGRDMRTELALPVRFSGQIIAVLNLESELEDAFAAPHVQSMLEACDTLAPIIAASKRSMEITAYHQVAVISALDKYLADVTSTLRHGTGTPASAVGLRLNELLERAEDPWLVEQLRVIQRSFRAIIGQVDSFISDIDKFSRYGHYSIRQLLSWAIDLNSPNEVARQGIRIELLPGPDFTVYCSLIFQHFIFDIIRNALYFLERRFEKVGMQPPGRIEVRVEKEIPPEGQEKDLNTRVKVTIRDNGIGASKETLAVLGTTRLTTRSQDGGSGLGLFALKNYVQHLGGSFELSSEENEYFEVTIKLNQKDPAIHGNGQTDVDDAEGRPLESVTQ